VADQYPDEFVFLVAEDLRAEAGGKITFLGAFTARDITVSIPGNQGSEGEPALQALGVYFGFRDGSGTFNARVEILDPSGNNILPSETPKAVRKEENAGLDLMVRISPFPLRNGTYRARAFLNDKMYERTFRVRIQRDHSEVASVAAAT
jgi:hypothetical protein